VPALSLATRVLQSPFSALARGSAGRIRRPRRPSLEPGASGARTLGAELAAGFGVWIIVLALVGVSAAADGPFKVTYRVKSRDAKATVLEGEVLNESDRDMVDVWVTAEALSSTGKVLATGIDFVSSQIASHRSTSFVAKLPAVEGTESFRVAVSSYRATTGSQNQAP